MKDYSNFYATAAQIIPVLILIFSIEAGGSRRTRGEHWAARWYIYVSLVTAGLGQLCALSALALGAPAPGLMVVPTFLGCLSALGLAVGGLFLLYTRRSSADGE